MLASDLYVLRNHLNEKGIVFAYSGYITEQVLTGVGEALKQKLTFEDADTKTIRSVFAIFVEQMQNIIRYSSEQIPAPGAPASEHVRNELRYGILTIGQEGNDYVVHAGNLIRTTDVDRIQDRLRAIRGMSPAELKAAYKDQLRSGSDEYSKGAGIGFIEIARRASKPIEFDFSRVDDQNSFFALKASI